MDRGRGWVRRTERRDEILVVTDWDDTEARGADSQQAHREHVARAPARIPQERLEAVRVTRIAPPKRFWHADVNSAARRPASATMFRVGRSFGSERSGTRRAKNWG